MYADSVLIVYNGLVMPRMTFAILVLLPGSGIFRPWLFAALQP